MERYHTGYIRHDGAFIALGCLYLAACLDDLAERLRLDFFRCYTGSLCLLRSEDDFIGIASVVMAMFFVCMSILGFMIMSFFAMRVIATLVSLCSFVLVCLFRVFMTMPFAIVGLRFVSMIASFVVMIMAIVVVIMLVAFVIVTIVRVIVSLVVVFMTMPFVIVGLFFSRMVVPFVVMIVAFVAMTRIA